MKIIVIQNGVPLYSSDLEEIATQRAANHYMGKPNAERLFESENGCKISYHSGNGKMQSVSWHNDEDYLYFIMRWS